MPPSSPFNKPYKPSFKKLFLPALRRLANAAHERPSPAFVAICVTLPASRPLGVVNGAAGRPQPVADSHVNVAENVARGEQRAADQFYGGASEPRREGQCVD